MNQRTQQKLQRIQHRLDGILSISTVEFQHRFSVCRASTLQYMRQLVQQYPEQFELRTQTYRGKPLYVLYNKDYQP